MITSSGSPFNLQHCLVILLLLPFYSLAYDPQALQDFCVAKLNTSLSVNGFPCKLEAETTSDDFYKALNKEGDTTGFLGSSVTPANVLAFPGVNTLGISMNRVDFAPGGLNPPHSHPRATETVLVISGKLLVGFISTNNVFYSKVLTFGEIFVIPQGLVHFQFNVGKGKALAFTSFNSQLPGVVASSVTLFGSQPSIPNAVLTKAFQVDDAIINTIKSKFGS